MLSDPFSKQVILIWEEGTYLATRYEEEDTVGLYHMDSFFVELYYDHVSNRIVERTRTFTSLAFLEDYTPYIQLKKLTG
ncbi:hypothetical protein [Hymenobacter wooponensis]|uniref:Uncharacterized protein n=1 Tax=Hymenobacter wooponensis TaxID=1525360 RepID=A0A4Z0MME8_9BACT|nr:hypothetical protein [Hymenobacter wooponensis]TGD80751.1 hypothetical protein EU557_13140 [Hymenobacter wooponensis]